MKGLIITKELELKLVDDVPVPEIGDYEALVEIKSCMICNGTDFGIMQGKVREVPRYPVVLGHEDAGYVVKVGNKVQNYKIGDLVLRAGQKKSEKYDSAWGGFAEYGVVKDYQAIMDDGADVEDAFLGITQQVCDPNMTSEEASMLITLKETYSAIRRCGIAKKKNMIIVGDGPVALSFLVGGKLQGIQDIIVIGNHMEKLEVAMKMGASKVYLGKEICEQDKKNLERNFEVCIDTVGSNTTIEQCTHYICEDGFIGVYGLHSGSRLDISLPEQRNFIIRYIQWPIPEEESAVHKEVSEAILNQRIDVNGFITHRYSIDDYQKGFDAIRNKEALKVVLNF